MKQKLFVVSICLMSAIMSHAQDFKKFRVGVGGGYAIPSGSGAKGGVLFYMEPSYRLSDALALGLRMEWAVMASGSSADLSSDVSFNTSSRGSYTLNGQYYLSANKFRPFVGVGLGIYSISAVSPDFNTGFGSVSGDFAPSATKFGFYPRVGFDLGHFTVSLDYNLVGKTTVSETDPFTQTTSSIDFKNSYLGIRFGGFFGGGRK